MTTAEELRSGKGHRDENFPVASRLIHPRHRPAILAFYNFVRTADDVADHPTLSEAEKIGWLDRLEGTLLGRNDDEPVGRTLRTVLTERGLSPRHAQDLLIAFRMDATKRRYADWDELIHYCSYSAMPVGRYVLDVHGESKTTWAANDALCAALQIINHLQDCGADYRNLDRVYIPLDALAAAGTNIEDLGATRSSPALLNCLRRLAERTGELLDRSSTFAAHIDDTRLAVEVSVIRAYANRLIEFLKTRDPLNEKVHLGKSQFFGLGLGAIVTGLAGRIGRSRTAPEKRPQGA